MVGCRLGSDGFGTAEFQRFNSWNGVVWRNDPDHCDILDEYYMDNDAMMRVFAAKAPVPMRTIIRPFDHWSVLARFQWGERQGQGRRWELKGVPQREVAFADLGLADNREYLVFEFWTQTFLGKAKGSFTAPAMDHNRGLQVFAIREARAHPWVLSTTRHLSQGGVSLLDEHWDGNHKVLSGKSAVVVGDPYVLTVQRPGGLRLESAESGGENAEIAGHKEAATVRIVPSVTRTVEWKMTFAR